MADRTLTHSGSFVDSNSTGLTHIGIDVHKNSFSVGILNSHGICDTAVRAADPQGILRLIQELDEPLGAVTYETGPTGFGLARALRAAGHTVVVAAASRIPRPAAPSSKTDRLDCRKLAHYTARGMLSSVAIPTEDQEAARTLIRRRNQLVKSLRTCKQRIKSLLLQFSIPEPQGLEYWTKQSVAMLEHTALPSAAMETLQSHLRELAFLTSEKTRIMKCLREQMETDGQAQWDKVLQSVPGVGAVISAAFRLEIFTPERFRRAEEVTSYIGLAPAVSQSGEGKARVFLRPTGQKMLRTLLVEAAWTFKRNDPQAQALYNRLVARHGVKQKAIVAVARKLAVILWRLSLEQRPYERRQ